MVEEECLVSVELRAVRQTKTNVSWIHTLSHLLSLISCFSPLVWVSFFFCSAHDWRVAMKAYFSCGMKSSWLKRTTKEDHHGGTIWPREVGGD